MRILWFTNTPSCYKTQKGGYNGGGWISSLEKEIKKISNVDLAICFHSPNKDSFKIEEDNVIYYPISPNRKIINKLYKKIGIHKKNDQCQVDKYLDVINDFKPDVINIFGSENSFGLISLKIKNIPIVLHIQGILTPYLTAYYPPKFSFYGVLFDSLNPLKILKAYRTIKDWHYNVKREQLMLSNIPYFMGRTEWDRRITNIYSPQAKYFICNEILRDIFYEETNVHIVNQKFNITTTISSPYYKGFDTILQAAYILKNNLEMDFIWNVFGISDVSNYERKFKIKATDCNIKIGGIVDAQTLVKQLKESTVFVHPSYIDNSPNSVCEAQMLGCPVIATNVGGISSLIKDSVSGFLIPANDPYQMAYLIRKIYMEKDMARKISINARKQAQERHNKNAIISDLMTIYNKICNND